MKVLGYSVRKVNFWHCDNFFFFFVALLKGIINYM